MTARRSGWRAGAVLGCALLAAPLAHADVWGFVDERGVAHFATEKVDERYQLFFRGGQGFDTAAGVASPRADTPRQVAVPTAPSKLIAYFEVAPAYKQIKHHLREASNRHGVDYELLKALIAAESGFDTHAVSPKGAVGLMQLMPATAERYGVSGDAQIPLERKLADPKTNIGAGTRYLRYLIDLFPGKLDLALAAYNAGEGAVQRAGNRIPDYRETQNYVKTVMQLYDMLKPPALTPAARAPARVRMELPGGAARRGNLPAAPAQGAATAPQAGAGPAQSPAVAVAAAPAEFKIERD